ASGSPDYGRDFETGFRTIDEALAVAEFGQTIRVVEGTYSVAEARHALVTMKAGVDLIGGYGDDNGDGTYDEDPELYETVLNGFEDPANIGSARLVNTVVLGADETELRGFTVRGGSGQGALRLGGGLAIQGEASMVVDTCIVEFNRANSGSGIGMRPGTALVIRESRIDNNGVGDGIFADRASVRAMNTDVLLSGSYGIFVNNEDLIVDGGRFIGNDDVDIQVNGASATISNAEFVGTALRAPTPIRGSGVPGESDSFEISNCVFDDTGQTGVSVASAIDVTDADVEVASSTIHATGSQATFRGDGAFTVINSIVWNTQTDLPVFSTELTPASTAVTYSIVHEDIGGTGNIFAAPQVVNAASGDLRLTSGSPAIDAADDTTAPLTDIVGTARNTNGVPGSTPLPDIGAYEFVAD
ncbi:MAG: right-handed parallel beta-helix repeat-containing protein, partial [Myxococcota bacterium]